MKIILCTGVCFIVIYVHTAHTLHARNVISNSGNEQKAVNFIIASLPPSPLSVRCQD
jgi:hypothetical protein